MNKSLKINTQMCVFNSGKTEIILFKTKQNLKLVAVHTLSLLASSSLISNLGSLFRSSVSVVPCHNIVKMAHLANIGTVTDYLSSGLL